ncbi:MAG: two-component regulator propeller domain-containing protein, partial [Bacteroidota bacterium]
MWLLVALPSMAQEMPFEVHPDYRIQHWTVTDGLPVNNVSDVVQTPDGYLWLGTFDGLVRFDGHRFVVFKTADHPELVSNRIANLHLGPHGDVWLATENEKVVRYADGVFEAFSEVEGRAINGLGDRTFYNDADTVWVKTTAGVFCYHDGQMTPFRPDLFAGNTGGFIRDRAGNVWVGDDQGSIVRVAIDGTYERFPMEDGASPVFQLLEDRAGKVWAATDQGVYVLDEERFVRRAQAAPSEGVYRITQDEAGDIWGYGLNGWWRYDQAGGRDFLAGERHQVGFIVPYERRDAEGHYWRLHGDKLYRDEQPILAQAHHNEIASFYLGNEGQLWVGGPKGLYLFQRKFIQTVGTEEGLPAANVYSVIEGPNGAMWAGLWSAQQPSLVQMDGMSIAGYRAGPWYPTALHIDSEGDLWVGSDGLYEWGGRAFTARLPTYGSVTVRNVRAIYEDQHDRFWVAEQDTLWMGQVGADPKTWHPFTVTNDLPHGRIQATYETPSDELLFATNGGGVLRVVEPSDARGTADPQQLAFEALTTAHGLASNQVRDLYEDRLGHLWIVTQDQGLCRLDRQGRAALQDGTLVCLNTTHGLFDNSLHRVLEDDQGRFWFNTNRGIFWVRHDELTAFTKGRIASVTSVSYTERDGLVNREGNGGVQSAGVRATDGALWFPSQGGLVIIDPANVPLAPEQAPHVLVEEVRSGEEIYSNAAVQLVAGVRDVEITYTAMAFSRSDNLRFQYWMEGYDEDWSDVGNRRVATYTNLGPGTYTFHVRAGLGGVWS